MSRSNPLYKQMFPGSNGEAESTAISPETLTLIKSLPAANLDQLLSSLPPDKKTLLLNALKDSIVSDASTDLLSFIHHMNPRFVEGRHHRIIADKLMAVEAGSIKRLMVFMPPRSGKSFMISHYYPAWFIGRRTNPQVLAVSYNIDLARNFGREVRNLVASPEYAKVFPNIGNADGKALLADRSGAVAWETSSGAIYNAAGVTAGIAGKGASLALIDDPLNEQDAYSKAAKEHVISWYPRGLRSRLMPGGAVILLMTRWALDDLAGHLLYESRKNPKREQWEVLRIPALLDEPSAALLGYAPGTTYWPPPPKELIPDGAELIGWTTEELEQTREELVPTNWLALYQQSPTAEGGNIFLGEYFRHWDEDRPPNTSFIFFSLDTAFSTKDGADYSAITVWGVFRNQDHKASLILLSAERGRWSFPELRSKLLTLYEDYQPNTILIENKASGQSLIQELQATNLPVLAYRPEGDKVARAHAAVPLIHDGRIYYNPKKDWARDFMEEVLTFPAGRHDDYVDTLTQAILWSRGGRLIFATDDIFPDDAPATESTSFRPKVYY